MVKKTKNTKVADINTSVTDASSKKFLNIKGTRKFLIFLSLSGALILFTLLIVFLNKRLSVAKVNGQVISRAEFYKELEKSQGSTVLEDMITKKIIFQEAKKNNINISESEIQKELDLIRGSVAQQGATLEDILAYQGMTYDQLVENVRIQKILEQLLKDSTSVSDDEIKARYDENRDIYGKDKTYEQLKEDIRYQIYQEKVTASYKSWIQEKINSSEIQRYL
jgi:parvulin-like peptidyl-prolyl isomerase